MYCFSLLCAETLMNSNLLDTPWQDFNGHGVLNYVNVSSE
jgi:hypothetical protein